MPNTFNDLLRASASVLASKSLTADDWFKDTINDLVSDNKPNWSKESIKDLQIGRAHV